MSVLRQAQPIRPIAPRRHLRPVTTRVQPVRRTAVKASTKVSSIRLLLSKTIVRKLLSGLTGVALLGLFVNSLCDGAVYKISELKLETAALATQSQIIGQQVDSLRSPQNLSNSAKALGMVVNSDPVFLNVRDATVLGSAVPASASATKAVSKNLIANAAMTYRSNPAALNASKKTTIDAPKLKTPVSNSVKPVNTGTTKVALTPVGIPATPTN
jgi:hypothetical protein